ncbi:MAG: hypothetical protein HYV15_07245, partial [Elusimicrobia bacterium]|nr:hypothetical protein [Elusimicrobiota bacterium]
MTKAAALALLLASPARADEAALLRALLPAVRAAEADLAIRVDRASAPFAVGWIEDSLRAPLTIPAR